jgi:P-type Cu+ transporter
MHVHLPKEPVYDERKQLIQQFGFTGFIGVLLLLNVTGVFTTAAGIDTAAILTLIAGYRTFFTAISGLLQRKVSADLAICIAVIAALASGQYLAAAEAMFIMLIGEALEGYAAGRTHAAIHRFVEQLPRHARVIRDGAEIEIDAAQLVPGDMVVVRPGERIPADGVIHHGASSIDESTITGEPLPRDKSAGDEVFSGTLNGLGPLRLTVTRAGAETTLALVIKLVEHAREKRAPVERLADRFARYFLPALLLVAGLTFYFTRDWMRTVSVLIVACPCALILATPAAMVAAIGGLARRGILVRGGAVLQNAAKVDTVFFDKTGTVTEGRFGVVKVLGWRAASPKFWPWPPRRSMGRNTCWPAPSWRKPASRLAIAQPDEAHIVPGRGVVAKLAGRTIVAGNAGFSRNIISPAWSRCWKRPIATAQQRCWWPRTVSWRANSSFATAFAKAPAGRCTISSIWKSRTSPCSRATASAPRKPSRARWVCTTWKPACCRKKSWNASGTRPPMDSPSPWSATV